MRAAAVALRNKLQSGANCNHPLLLGLTPRHPLSLRTLVVALAGRSRPSPTSSLKTLRPTWTPSGYTAPAPACSDSGAGRGEDGAAGRQRLAAGALLLAVACCSFAQHAAGAKYRCIPCPACGGLPALMPSSHMFLCCSLPLPGCKTVVFSTRAAGRLACKAKGGGTGARCGCWLDPSARPFQALWLCWLGHYSVIGRQAGRLSLVWTKTPQWPRPGKRHTFCGWLTALGMSMQL